MATETKSKTKNGFAKVPHGIADARIPDTLKLFIWLCYDRPADWTYSVPEVARTMDKTPQCIRKYFRLMLDAGAFTKAGTMEVKHGIIPLYSFHPDKVPAVVTGQLKVNPETNPETDPETDVETNPESRVSHTNTDIPKHSTENESTKTDSKKESQPPAKAERVAPVELGGDSMAEAFEKLFQDGATSLV